MPRGRGKGGYQAPAKPAAVSGPGAMSARTDSAVTQPIRVASGGDFGDRQASMDLQQAAPLAAAGPTLPPGGPAAAPFNPIDVYAPSDNPNMPLTAGAAMGPGPGAPNPIDPVIELVRALYNTTPTDELRDVLEELEASR